jgi:hypothetical protein
MGRRQPGLPVVRFLAVTGAVFGAVMLGIDCAVGMPLPWTAGEGPYGVALSAVILWLTGRRRFPSTSAAPCEITSLPPSTGAPAPAPSETPVPPARR